MFKSTVPDIFCKNNHFLCILRSQFCLRTVQNNKEILCKTWHSLNINFTLIMKFNLENQIFYLCPDVAGFKKNVFKRSEHI